MGKYVSEMALIGQRSTVPFSSVVEYHSFLQLSNLVNSHACSNLQFHTNDNDEPHEQDELDNALHCHRSTLANEYLVGQSTMQSAYGMKA